MTLQHTIETLNRNIDLEDEQAAKDVLIARRDTLQHMQQGGAKDLQFVVAAMTRAEAENLLAGKTEIFQDENTPKDYRKFLELKQQLDALLPGDAEREAWLRHYKETREGWTPHIYSVPSEKTIVEFIEEIAISAHPNLTRTFWPHFMNSIPNLFAAETALRAEAWNTLEPRRILLIDGLSLFYPTIRSILRNFAFQGIGQHGAALVFSHHEATIRPIDAVIESEVAKQMPWLFDQFDSSANPLYEIGANHAQRIKRWLCAGVPHIMEPSGANPGNLMPGPTYNMSPGGPRS